MKRYKSGMSLTKGNPPKRSLNILVSRNIPEHSNNISFDHNSLKLYMLIEGKESLIDIYQKTDLDIDSFIEALKKLFKQGLIVRVPTQKFVSQEKIEDIKSSLANYVGPVAQVIVADAFASLGLPNERLPVPKVDLLIEKITDQIPFDKALEFKRSVEYVIEPEF